MAQFINEKEMLVQNALDGLLRCSGGANLARLDGYPGIKVILRTDHKPTRVAIIAGGGSGHEPAHVGFVGPGMLSAAVCGEIFASPSIDAVFAAIMAVCGPAGCLLIFKNYTGDRLNFGLAVERARVLGKKVEVVIIKDDISIPDVAQPRGIAGVMFVHKIAGHYAEKGWPLHKVAKVAQRAADALVSLGLAVSSCTIPGVGREDRIPRGKAELGLGIHGEPGVELIKLENATQVANIVITKLFAKVKPARSYALLINNLGATIPLELGLLANEVLSGRFGKKIKLVCGPANLVTSLDMHGFSFSLLPLTAEFEIALKSRASPLGWPGVYTHAKPRLIKLTKNSKIIAYKPSRNSALAKTLECVCNVILQHEVQLNALDARVGDGDTGSTLATAASFLLKNHSKLPLAKQDQFFAALSQMITQAIGGSSGVLLAIFFSAAAQSTNKDWKVALQMGLERMMAVGGAKQGDRTMLDALIPAVAALRNGDGLVHVAVAARKGADATASMIKAQAGRSSYVSATNLIGTNDPGAEAVALVFEGLSRA